jgi:hypothetical protein
MGIEPMTACYHRKLEIRSRVQAHVSVLPQVAYDSLATLLPAFHSHFCCLLVWNSHPGLLRGTPKVNWLLRYSRWDSNP